MGDDVAKCNKDQIPGPCSSGIFPNLGTTHCFTAAGRYSSPESQSFVSTGIIRGCINCTGGNLISFGACHMFANFVLICEIAFI